MGIKFSFLELPVKGLGLLIACTFALGLSCRIEQEVPTNGGLRTAGGEKKYKTEHVFILVVDGPRYSETWGESTHKLIPNCEKIFGEDGCVFTSFWNKGPTFTTAGHTALLTGTYQFMDGFGFDKPNYPGIFQYWLNNPKNSQDKAWIVASKDKLSSMVQTTHPDWAEKPTAKSNCGFGGFGFGSGYRSDYETYDELIKVTDTYHPSLVMINFLAPDFFGHQNNWELYLQGIALTDDLIAKFWEHLQKDPIYKDKTTLFVTNDHGRHTDGHMDGFISHGDTCEGCEHINLFAIGPDFKVGYVCENHFEQIDITATTAELMGLKMEYSKGRVMTEIFK